MIKIVAYQKTVKIDGETTIKLLKIKTVNQDEIYGISEQLTKMDIDHYNMSEGYIFIIGVFLPKNTIEAMFDIPGIYIWKRNEDVWTDVFIKKEHYNDILKLIEEHNIKYECKQEDNTHKHIKITGTYQEIFMRHLEELTGIRF